MPDLAVDPGFAALAGGFLGALAAGLSQLLLLGRQRKHELANRQAELKRAVYEKYLKLVLHFVRDFTESWIEHGDGWAFRKQHDRALAEIRIAVLLDGSATIRAKMNTVADRMTSYWTDENLEAVRQEARDAGMNEWLAIENGYWRHIEQLVQELAEAMRNELYTTTF